MSGATDSTGGNSRGGSAGAGSMSGATGSTGGNSSSGGAGGGGAGSSGSVGVTPGIACYRYIEAKAKRIAECRGVEDLLGADSARSCPQAFLSPGSTRTIDSLLACAQVWASFDCDRAFRGEVPDCVTPGTFGPGEKCSFGSQCRSLVCHGTCTTPAPSGGPCSDTVTCPLGQTCVASVCTRSEPPGSEAMDGPTVGAGGACIWPANCRSGLFCEFVTATPGTGRCAVPPSAGAACGDAQGRGVLFPSRSTCDDASYCGKDEMCHDLPPIGAACGEARYNGTLHCAKGGYCDTSTMKCVPALGLGEGCHLATVYSRTGQPLTEQCDPSVGAACTCPRGLLCNGQDGTCAIRRNPGETCTRDVEICARGSSCIQGICDYPAIASP